MKRDVYIMHIKCFHPESEYFELNQCIDCEEYDTNNVSVIVYFDSTDYLYNLFINTTTFSTSYIQDSQIEKFESEEYYTLDKYYKCKMNDIFMICKLLLRMSSTSVNTTDIAYMYGTYDLHCVQMSPQEMCENINYEYFLGKLNSVNRMAHMKSYSASEKNLTDDLKLIKELSISNR